MATRDAGDAVATLQSMATDTFDSSQLVLMACMGFQKVTQSRLEEFRLKHRPEVLAALQERSIELHLWRNSNSTMTEKLPYLYSVPDADGETLLIKKSIVVTEEKMEKSINGLTNRPQADGAFVDHQEEKASFEEISVEKAITDSINSKPIQDDPHGDAREQVSLKLHTRGASVQYLSFLRYLSALRRVVSSTIVV